MKKYFLLSSALMVVMSAVAAETPSSSPSGTNQVLIYSYFRNNGETGVYLACSRDGLTFNAVNDDKPVMSPAKWPDQQLTRDPSIVYQDGKFHMVWTSGWYGRCFGYAISTDLVHWSEPVKVQPFPVSLPKEDQPRNMWAPEICWDPIQSNYAIIWSSTTDRESNNDDGSSMSGKNGDLDHRIYITRTTDGKTFTDAKVFFDPKFCCIDGQMLYDSADSRWILVFKHEKEIKLGGKNLRLSFADPRFEKPWSAVSEPIIGPGSSIRSNEMAEGPCLVKWNGRWFLYWDAFANGHYCLATSSDLKTWTDETAQIKMPPHPRHGTVLRAPESAVGWLKQQ